MGEDVSKLSRYNLQSDTVFLVINRYDFDIFAVFDKYCTSKWEGFWVNMVTSSYSQYTITVEKQIVVVNKLQFWRVEKSISSS